MLYSPQLSSRYHELGQYTFGKKWGDIIVITPQVGIHSLKASESRDATPSQSFLHTFDEASFRLSELSVQLIVMIGLGITYSVTGGQSLYRFWG